MDKWVSVKDALGIDGTLMKIGDTSANMKAGRFKSTEEPSRTIVASHTAELLDTDKTPDELYELWQDRPSYTIVASEWKGTWKEKRRASRLVGRKLTWKECAKLQGFPDTYKFNGSDRDIYRQVGNAVPPPMSRIFGEMAVRMETVLSQQ